LRGLRAETDVRTLTLRPFRRIFPVTPMIARIGGALADVGQPGLDTREV
jgi:hypothetical protein